jgi:hypothetical protein
MVVLDVWTTEPQVFRRIGAIVDTARASFTAGATRSTVATATTRARRLTAANYRRDAERQHAHESK